MLSNEATAVTPLPSAAVEPENSPIWPSLPAARVQGTPCYVVAVSTSEAIWVRDGMARVSTLCNMDGLTRYLQDEYGGGLTSTIRLATTLQGNSFQPPDPPTEDVMISLPSSKAMVLMKI